MGVGALKVVVTLCSSTSASHGSASKWRYTTTLPPNVCTAAMKPSGPEW